MDNKDDKQSIFQQVISILEQNGLENESLIMTLNTIVDDYLNLKYETIQFEKPMFYTLQDLIWYNFEHVPQGGEEFGKTTLKYLGTKYPYLIYKLLNQQLIDNKDLNILQDELKNLLNEWKEKSPILVEIYSTEDVPIVGGDKPTEIIIHKSNEHPSKYADDTTSKALPFVDVNGNQMVRPGKNYLYCRVYGEINTFEQENILKGNIERLQQAVNSAVQNEKGLWIQYK